MIPAVFVVVDSELDDAQGTAVFWLYMLCLAIEREYIVLDEEEAERAREITRHTISEARAVIQRVVERKALLLATGVAKDQDKR